MHKIIRISRGRLVALLLLSFLFGLILSTSILNPFLVERLPIQIIIMPDDHPEPAVYIPQST